MINAGYVLSGPKRFFVKLLECRPERPHRAPDRSARGPQSLTTKSIDLQRVRPPRRSELVGSHLRGDRLYGEVVSSRRPTLAVRSEIGPYRRPSQRYLALPKIIRDATPMKSSFPSTDGASQVKCSKRAADGLRSLTPSACVEVYLLKMPQLQSAYTLNRHPKAFGATGDLLTSSQRL